MDFSAIAATYDANGLVQKDSARALFDLADIKPGEDVLDVGCGPGFLTRLAKEKSGGRVVGVDPSPGMIEEARKNLAGSGVTWVLKSAEGLDYREEFDVVLCNSAFQWVVDADKAASGFYAALRPGGRVAMQSPAKKVFCPAIIRAVREVEKHPETSATYAAFKNPWLFLETVQAYQGLFENAGFNVAFCRIAQDTRRSTPEEALQVFASGAAMAYLNQDCYSREFYGSYVEKFWDIIRKSFESQAEADGLIGLSFNRVYLVAVK
ncbi:MAG: methyltransferase domain-containing protein [Nitrospinae bacterium]|nr:methyltransferase domain-containing protein [Nitrospinota bacterium]